MALVFRQRIFSCHKGYVFMPLEWNWFCSFFYVASIRATFNNSIRKAMNWCRRGWGAMHYHMCGPSSQTHNFCIIYEQNFHEPKDEQVNKTLKYTIHIQRLFHIWEKFIFTCMHLNDSVHSNKSTQKFGYTARFGCNSKQQQTSQSLHKHLHMCDIDSDIMAEVLRISTQKI